MSCEILTLTVDVVEPLLSASGQKLNDGRIAGTCDHVDAACSRN